MYLRDNVQERLFCECCGMRLRASPANREFKEKVRAKKKLIAVSWAKNREWCFSFYSSPSAGRMQVLLSQTLLEPYCRSMILAIHVVKVILFITRRAYFDFALIQTTPLEFLTALLTNKWRCWVCIKTYSLVTFVAIINLPTCHFFQLVQSKGYGSKPHITCIWRSSRNRLTHGL
jgi:hypothetical protein